MTISKRLLALLMALAMCFALAACNSGEEDPSDSVVSDSADPSESVSAEIEADLTQNLYEFASGLQGGDTAVTVNGEAVSNEMFLYWLAYDCYNLQQYYYTYYYSTPDFTNADTAEYLLSDAQDLVAYLSILRALCQERGITITDEQQAELQDMIDEYKETSGEDGFQKLVQSYGSEETFQDINTNTYLFSNLADALMGEPTDADLEQYVSDNGIFSVKHILLLTTDTDTTDDDGNVTQTADEYNAAQKELAEDLLAQLQASDDMETLFDSLMNEYSEDTGLPYYPDGYVYDNTASLVDGFREASLALEPGQISGVVETDYGYHIILRLPVDPGDYHDEWISAGADAIILEQLDSAEVSVSDGIANLDVASFYERYLVYMNALFADDSSDE